MRSLGGGVPIVIAMLLAPPAASAAGPTEVARWDGALRPEPLDSRTAFDRASRAEIAGFVQALAELDAMPTSDRLRLLGVARIDTDSVAAWRRLTLERLAANIRLASVDCRDGDGLCAPQMTPDALMAGAAAWDAGMRERMRPWRDEARAFYRSYAAEQFRLAALFPRTTSEVLTFSDQEKTGFEHADRHFLLTFDDGPTAPGGTTDRLLAVLRAAGRNGTFYMLGERVQSRRLGETPDSLRGRFAGMCVASHGWRHDSHQRLAAWPRSVSDGDQILRETFGPLYRPLFRPPYGQRTAETGTLLAAQGVGLALWNIDSRDWSSGLDAQDVAARVVRLMLLWRRGVILFHDVHDRAGKALPLIWGATQRSGVVWRDCRDDD